MFKVKLGKKDQKDDNPSQLNTYRPQPERRMERNDIFTYLLWVLSHSQCHRKLKLFKKKNTY